MRRRVVAGLVMIGLAVVLVFVGIAYVGRHGFSARAEPSRVEAVAARYIRRVMVPRAVRDLRDPVQSGPQVIKDGMAHFADHLTPEFLERARSPWRAGVLPGSAGERELAIVHRAAARLHRGHLRASPPRSC